MLGRTYYLLTFHLKTMLGLLARVGKSVKNSTDTIFELEVLAQKTRAKIRIHVQKRAKRQKFRTSLWSWDSWEGWE